MSIIHDALKKVQTKMKRPDQKPEDVVEYLPSSSIDKPSTSKYSLLQSFLIITVCLIVTGASFYIAYIQLQKQYPQYFSKSNASELNKQIEKAFENISIANILKPFKGTKETKSPQPVAKPKTVVPVNVPVVPQNVPTHAAADSSTAPTTTTAKPIAPPPPPSTTDEINLQGIMSNATGNVALINNNIYEEGAVLQNGIKIIKIGLQNITVEQNGKEEVIAVSK